jgi:cardiolipin synthase
MSSRTLTPANQITILRLAFIPVFATLVISQMYRGALAVLVAAALSDIADGMVARLLKQETPLGVALDPIADKLLMTTAYLTLAFRDVLPWWLTILVISRDVAIIMTALLISLVAGYRPFHPTYLGKASTVVQVATIFVALSFRAGIPYVTASVVQVFVYLAAALTGASGIHYLIVARHRYGHAAPEQAASEPASASRQGPSEP